MSNKLVQDFRDGVVMHWTATASKSVNALVQVDHFVGVALIAGSTGDVIPLASWGVYTLTKPTGVAFGQGSEVYWTGSALTGTDTANTFVGLCWEAATSGTGKDTVKVGLKGPTVNALTI
jgi:predicted RecA/RadA family phage recombinase